ncbi:hypothetical protein Psyaliredsea_06310 [Psychrobacter alimentarius]
MAATNCKKPYDIYLIIDVVWTMKVRILSVGNKMPNWVQTGFDEYHKRIQPMLSTDIIEIAAAKRAKIPQMPI